MLLLPGFAVLALIQLGFGHAIFPQDLQSTQVVRGILRPAQKRNPGSAQRLCGKSGYLCELVLQHLLWRPDVGEEEVQEVAWTLGVDLFFAKIDVRDPNWFRWC